MAGLSSAKQVVGALSEVRPDFVLRFYGDRLDQLRKLTPPDETGYLAFIDVRAALLSLESQLHEGFLATYDKWSAGKPIASRWVEAFAPRDVDAIIEEFHLQGPSLREGASWRGCFSRSTLPNGPSRSQRSTRLQTPMRRCRGSSRRISCRSRFARRQSCVGTSPRHGRRRMIDWRNFACSTP